VDGKTVLDYWDRSLPYTRGRIGLADWKSTVRVERFPGGKGRRRRRAATAQAGLPFRADTEHPQRPSRVPHDAQNGVIVFDGHEPISYFWKQPPDAGGEGSRGALFHEAVKLKPGWRPAFYTYIGPNGPVLAGKVAHAGRRPSRGFQGHGVRRETRLHLPDRDPGDGPHGLRLHRDLRRAARRLPLRVPRNLRLSAAAQVNEFELFDPLVYNNRTPGPEVVHRLNPAGHRWWVYQGTNSGWERMPLTDYPNDYNTDSTTPARHGARWPTSFTPTRQPARSLRQPWRGPSLRDASSARASAVGAMTTTIAKWAARSPSRQATSVVRHAFTALPPASRVALLPVKPDAVPARGKARSHSFIPTGTTFAVTTTWQDPSATMVWLGGTRDETTGHGDSASLRIDGPGKARVLLYQYIVEQTPRAGRSAVGSRPRDVAGTGVTLRVSMPMAKRRRTSLNSAAAPATGPPSPSSPPPSRPRDCSELPLSNWTAPDSLDRRHRHPRPRADPETRVEESRPWTSQMPRPFRSTVSLDLHTFRPADR